MSEIQHRLPPVQQPSVRSSATAQTTSSFQQQQGSKPVVKQEPVLNTMNESQPQLSPPQTTTLPRIAHLNKTQPPAQPQQSPQSTQQSPQQAHQLIKQPPTTQQIHPVQVINQVPPQHQAQLQHQLQNAPPLPQSGPLSQNPVHPNAKTTTHVNNGTTTTKTNITSPVCRNCKTQTTPLWRRDETGQVLCNACGLFLKLHGRPRPISLKTDTIKSRNRIKQQNGNSTGPGSNKSSSPNTPELKSKDSKSGKKSPKSKKSGKPNQSGNEGMGHNPALTPLLPASGAGGPSGNSQGSPGFPHPINAYHHHHHHHHLPPHLQGHANGITSHQVVQPLHYPSSTPTQFAPGLQRITSPLLLSTSSSVSNTRTNSENKMIAVHAAAGALENMSNELGPSATFRSNSGSTSGNEGTTVAGVSLMNKHNSSVKRESPSTSSAIFSSALKTASSTPQSHPPKLPALGGSKISSPSFNPQSSQSYSRSSTPNGSRIQSPETSHTSLPPINQVASQSGDSKNQLPHIQHSFNSYNQLQQPPNQPHGEHPNGFPNSNNSNSHSNNNNNNNNNNNHEVTLLKTRISELELVNDLYRTRIMELEAMEQAARLRESSMKKRLDEVLTLRNAPPAAAEAAQAAQAAPPSYPQSTTSEVPVTTHQHPSVPAPQSSFATPRAPTAPVPQTSAPLQTQAPLHAQAAGITLPPATSLSSGINRFGDLQPIHRQQGATVLPAIRSLTEPTSSPSNNIVLPSLKRDNDDEYGSDIKKTRY